MIYLSEQEGFSIYTGDMCDLTTKETSTVTFVADCSLTCSQDAQCFYFGFSQSLQKCFIFETCPVLEDNTFVIYQKRGLYLHQSNH